MKEIFESILSVSLSGSIIILLVLVLRLLLKKAPKRYICLLWLLAAVRLLIPFNIESSFSLQPNPEQLVDIHIEDSTIQENVAPPDVQPDDIVISTSPGQNIVITPGDVLPDDAVVNNSVLVPSPPDTAGDPVTNVTRLEIDWLAIVSYIWGIGTCGFLAYTVISFAVLKRKVRDAVQVDDGIYECAAIESPFLLGYVRPNIYLPAGLPLKDIDYILSHERAHIERGDNWVKLAGFLCVAIHWFNPLVWVAYALLCRDIEMACDEHVVKYMSIDDRKAYSGALLNCAAQHRSISACPVAFGEVSVKQRILTVLNYRKPGFWISLVSVIAIVFVAVCFMTSPITADKHNIPGFTTPTSDMPDALDPMEQCRQALTQLQASENHVLYQHQYMTAGPDAEYSLAFDDAVYVRHGADWYRRFAYTDWTEEFLQVGDRQFAHDTTAAIAEKDIRYLNWTETDITEETYYDVNCWLVDLNWEDEQVSLLETSGQEISVTVTNEHYDEGYCTITFCFDEESGALVSAVRTIPHSDGEYTVYTVYVVSTNESDAANVIGSYFDAAQGLTGSNHPYTMEELQRIREEIDDADYPSLTSVGTLHNRLQVEVCFASSSPETELAMLQLQMRYGTAVYVVPVPIQAMPSDEDLTLPEQCRQAVETWINAESCHLRVDAVYDSKTTVMNYSTQTEYLRCGDDWYHHYFIDEQAFDREVWEVQKDGIQYRRQCDIVMASGQKTDSGWSESRSLESYWPWFTSIDWNTVSLTYLETDGASGSRMYSFQLSSDADSTVSFCFNADGEMISIIRKYTIISELDTVSRATVTFSLISTDAAEITAAIESHYQEARLSSSNDETNGAMSD